MKENKINEKSLEKMEQELDIMSLITESLNNARYGYEVLRATNPKLATHVGLTIGSAVMSMAAELLKDKRDAEYQLEDII